MNKRSIFPASGLWLQLLLLFAGAVAHAQPGGWSVNPAGYQYNMTLVAQIRIDGAPNHMPDNHLAVFAQGQIRGYAVPVMAGGQAYYFMNLFSNVYKGDSLYFRAWIGAEGKVYESTDTLVFRHQLAVGSIGEPYQVHLFLGENPLIYSLPVVDYTAGACPDVMDVQASDDLNSEGNGLTFSIEGGADAGLFAVNPATGVLSWYNFMPVFSSPGDADGDNRYEVTVRVADQSDLYDIQHITVNVLEGGPQQSIVCPANRILATSDDETGDCGTTATQITPVLPNPCAAVGLFYVLSGATSGEGSGPVPADQIFGKGSTTVTYILAGSGECAFTVTVNDDEPPALGCPDDQIVSPNVFSPCGAQASGIEAIFSDNCPGVYLTYFLSGAGAGSGDGQATGTVFPTGVTTVTYTAADGADLGAVCSFTVTVTACNTEFIGTVVWENDGASGVQTTTVSLTGAATGSAVTDVNGDFQITLSPMTGDFTLKPAKNINKLNGVTSADVTAIQQHVANTALLPAPFKRIAADVNKSNSITAIDATLLHQALLGNPSALNQITSWRFVPTAYDFPNPNVPWGFPEQIDLAGASGQNSGLDFYGIKLGDVVVTWADPANFGADEPLTLRVQDRDLQAGEEIEAVFRADLPDDLHSLQFALHFDPEWLQLLDIEPLAGLPLAADNFGVYDVTEGDIRVVWAQASGVPSDEATALFRLRFRALESGAHLSEVLALNEASLPGRCYDGAFAEKDVVLVFQEATGQGAPPLSAKIRLLQNRPNPFSGRTAIGFSLPENSEVTLRIFDMNGRLLRERTGIYAAGEHTETFEFAADGIDGVLLYELTTSAGVLSGKMVLVR